MFGIPSDMSKDGACRPSAVKNKGHLASNVWTGWTTSWAALPARSRRGRLADFLLLTHKVQIQEAYSIHGSSLYNR